MEISLLICLAFDADYWMEHLHTLSMWTGLPLVMAASDFLHEAYMKGSKGT